MIAKGTLKYNTAFVVDDNVQRLVDLGFGAKTFTRTTTLPLVESLVHSYSNESTVNDDELQTTVELMLSDEEVVQLCELGLV